MKANYKPLGDYIRLVDERNNDLLDLPLMGLSVSKIFFPSIANLVGTDMSTYKIVYKNQFTYIADTSRRGEKIAIALSEEFDKMLVSQAYTPFEVKDTDELLPEYLMMWFRRPEFDRYARFMSHGSAREIFDWSDMCNTLLPIPSIAKQKEIVKEYNVIQNRITLNQQLIKKLEETAQTIYKQWFVDFEFPDENGKPYKSSGGEMVESELGEIPLGWEVKPLKSICSKIGSGSTPTGGKESYHKEGTSLIRSMNVYDFIFSSEDLAFIDDKQAKSLDGVSVKKQDILLNITGVSVARCCIVPEFVLPARVNQHVMIIRPIIEYHLSNYLLCLLCYSENKAKLLGISQSGSTREAITKEEVDKFNILIPNKLIAKQFDENLTKVLSLIEINILSNIKLNDFKNLLLSKLATIEN
jgi:type I restriction enzyme, S subunit